MGKWQNFHILNFWLFVSHVSRKTGELKKKKAETWRKRAWTVDVMVCCPVLSILPAARNVGCWRLTAKSLPRTAADPCPGRARIQHQRAATKPNPQAQLRASLKSHPLAKCPTGHQSPHHLSPSPSAGLASLTALQVAIPLKDPSQNSLHADPHVSVSL